MWWSIHCTTRTSHCAFPIVLIIKTWTAWPKLWNRYPGDPGNPDNLYTHSKVVVWNLHKKWVLGMEAGLAANGRYLLKKKCRTNVLGKWRRCEWINSCFRSFFLFFFWRGTHNCFPKSSCNSRSIRHTTSVGACWKGNVLTLYTWARHLHTAPFARGAYLALG